MTGDQLTQVDGAIRAHEARTTAAQASVMTRAVVTTRVVMGAVWRGTCVTDVRRWTGTAVTGDQVRTGAAIQTWLRCALVSVGFTVGPCM